jgi:hypothetical protein
MDEEIKTATQMAKIAKDPSTYSAITYAWVLAIALLGGIVRIVKEKQLGDKSWKQIVGIFLTELLISCFAGVNTFFLCESLDAKPLYTALMVSTASYMGGRALMVAEAWFSTKFGKGE